MKAYRLQTPTLIQPFQDAVGDSPILNRPLSEVQQQALETAGLRLVEQPPVGEPYLLISDRIWFTAELIRSFVEFCQKDKKTGRMVMLHEQWDAQMSPLQDNQDGYDIAIVTGNPSFEGCDKVVFDWQLQKSAALHVHVTMQHAHRDLWESPRLAHHITHWSHLLRVNHLAIGNLVQEAKLAWETAGFWKKCLLAWSFIRKFWDFNRQKFLRRIGSIGKNCKIHPTAVIEACHIGDNVEIGPYAVVRASVIGAGSKIEEHTTVNVSVVGKNCQIGRYATANLCVLFDESLISHGGGLQGCIFGRRSFLAIGVQILDLSFGRNIQVEAAGKWVDSGQMFLGAAVGHGATIGNAVRINYGVSIPNDVILVASTDDLIRDALSHIQTEQATNVYQVRQGKIFPLGKKSSKKSS